jgi:hypothetical protein
MATIDEWNKFLASAPEAEQEFRTIEFYHSQFGEVIRLVNKFTDKTFTLESTAPRNANQAVLFTSFSLQIEEPAENKEDDASLNISLGGIGGIIQDQMAKIDGDGLLEPIQCIYRKYYSGDLGEPVTALYLSVNSIVLDSYKTVKINAEDADLLNKNSGERYTLLRFPQLQDN